MGSIDERVVSMKFDNAQFQRGTSETMSSLDKLNSTLKMAGAVDGLSEVDKASRGLNFAGPLQALEQLASRLGGLGVIGVAALSTIASQAVTTGMQLAKSLSLDLVMDGFNEYETKMGSIQTILANTHDKGTQLSDVTACLDQLNNYADKTIYSFGDMTKNIGLFTNAGLGVQDSTSMIKGFSNAAAASGTNAQGAASAAYQLSQALSAGTIRLMDWRSLQNVGMGNKVMQNGLIEIANAMGEVSKHGETVTGIQKDFNGSLEKGWLSADVMSKYLKIMAGDMSDAQMKEMGLTDAQIKDFKEQQVIAEDAATKVRTLSQLVGTVKEAIGSGWAETFEIVFGNFNTATEVFTGINNVVSKFVTNQSNARNNLLKTWSSMGGRANLLTGLASGFQNLLLWINPVRVAFKDIFPPVTVQMLLKITQGLSAFISGLTPSFDTINKLTSVFRGLFAVMDIIGRVLLEVGKGILALTGHVGNAGGNILTFAANIGDMLTEFDHWLRSTNEISKIFSSLGKILAAPIAAVRALGDALGAFFGGLVNSSTGGGKGLQAFFDAAIVGPLMKFGATVTRLFDQIHDIIESKTHSIENLGHELGVIIGKMAKNLADAVETFVKGLSFKKLNDALEGAGFIATVYQIISVIQQLRKRAITATSFIDKIKGVIGSIGGVFGQLKKGIIDLQNNVKVKTLKEIATTLLLLAAAILILSTINPEKLAAAMGAITVALVELMGTLQAMSKIASAKDIGKINGMASSLILVSVAIDLLVLAIKGLSTIPLKGLEKGLLSLGVMLAELALFLKVSDFEGMGIKSGAGLLLVAAALDVMATVVQKLSVIPWEGLVKGVVTMGILLAEMDVFSNTAKTSIGSSTGMVIAASAMEILANVMAKIGKLSWKEIIKGLVGIGGAMVILAVGLTAMDGGIMGAASLVIAAAAITILSDAMGKMGKMSWGDIAKSMVELFGMLTLLALAMYAMEGALPGAAALLVVAPAILILGDAMKKMSNFSWGDIAKGLVTLAGSLTALALGLTFMTLGMGGVLVLTAVIPALTGLQAVMKGFAGMSWGDIAKGIGAIVLGLGALGVAGMLVAPTVPALMSLGVALILIGGAVALAGVGILALSVALTGLAAAGAGVGLVITTVVTAFLSLIPMAAQALAQGLVAFATTIAASAPALVNSAVAVVLAILNGINTIAPQIIATVSNLLILLLNAIITISPLFFAAAVVFITGLLQAIEETAPKIINTLMFLISTLLQAIENNVPGFVQKGFDIIMAFMQGIENNIPSVARKGGDIIIAFVEAIGEQAYRVADAAAKTVIQFVNSVADSINNNAQAMRDAGARLAFAIADGMTGGLASKARDVINSARDMINQAIQAMFDAAKSKSPSRKTMELGGFMSQGLAIGMDNESDRATRSARAVATGVINTLNSTLGDIDTPDVGDISIKPIIDLTDVEAGFKKIGTMATDPKMAIGVTAAQAQAIAASRTAATVAQTVDSTAPQEVNINFEQNIHSPKEPSRLDIYRDTKNLVSMLKEGPFG